MPPLPYRYGYSPRGASIGSFPADVGDPRHRVYYRRPKDERRDARTQGAYAQFSFSVLNPAVPRSDGVTPVFNTTSREVTYRSKPAIVVVTPLDGTVALSDFAYGGMQGWKRVRDRGHQFFEAPGNFLGHHGVAYVGGVWERGGGA